MIGVIFCIAKYTSIATCVYSNMAQMPVYQAARGCPPPVETTWYKGFEPAITVNILKLFCFSRAVIFIGKV